MFNALISEGEYFWIIFASKIFQAITKMNSCTEVEENLSKTATT